MWLETINMLVLNLSSTSYIYFLNNIIEPDSCSRTVDCCFDFKNNNQYFLYKKISKDGSMETELWHFKIKWWLLNHRFTNAVSSQFNEIHKVTVFMLCFVFEMFQLLLEKGKWCCKLKANFEEARISVIRWMKCICERVVKVGMPNHGLVLFLMNEQSRILIAALTSWFPYGDSFLVLAKYFVSFKLEIFDCGSCLGYQYQAMVRCCM